MKFSYQFKDKQLAERALVHRSSGASHNERLEFLGDSILSAVIADALFSKFTSMPEGELTRLRAHLVCGESLSEIAEELGLEHDVKLGPGEMKSGGVKKSTLADALEALLGAVYIDGGFGAAQKVILDIFASRLATLDPKQIKKDPKTALQEYCQKHKLELPQYTLIDESGPMHDQTFTVEVFAADLKAIAKGGSRRVAEKSAAQKILDQL